MPITNYYDMLKTKREFEQEADKYKLDRQLLESQVKKNSRLDVDALGEEALMLTAQGLPLSPQHKAAMTVVNAKSMGMGFDPATGASYQKKSILERMGIGDGGYMQTPSSPQQDAGSNSNPFGVAPMSYGDMSQGFEGGVETPPPRPNMWTSIPEQVRAEYEQRYAQALESARGNPKLTQELKTKYFKDMSEMGESQSKAAGFSDRVIQSEPILSDPAKIEAGSSLWEKTKASIPLLGNYVVSDDFRSFSQAQRDFINAILRRESGAVIADSEFANAAQQYFPQPGDDQAVLAQKKANRDAALRGLVVSAGPAYQPITAPPATPQVSDRASVEETLFNAKKAVRNGADREAVRQRLIEAGINPILAGL